MIISRIKQAKAEHDKKHEAGPVGLIVLRTNPGAPMGPSKFAVSFIINLLCTLISAWLLWLARGSLPRYWSRVGFVGLLGLLTGIMVDGNYWNWMFFAADYSLVMLADRTVGWLLVGLLLGAIIRPDQKTSPATDAG